MKPDQTYYYPLFESFRSTLMSPRFNSKRESILFSTIWSRVDSLDQWAEARPVERKTCLANGLANYLSIDNMGISGTWDYTQTCYVNRRWRYRRV
ncbi:hypothetical protein RRG08_053644 [Elysia crispata]|uniref:Uncharacterized protein n=1 Tax=Elysia crispata TaxID=231223 RepID=A0AAE1A0M5_9GAST|nr:hypothetical protein RRG08_053644 [Elysia crispata]